MKSMIVFAVLFSVAYAGVIHAPAAAIVASAPVFTKTIHHQPALAPVQTVERTVQAVAHPSVTTLHQAPTTVLAKAPKISGYSYTSDVRHDATVAAAPVAVAAPVVHAAAPVVHAAPVAHAVAAPVAHAVAAPVVHAAPVAHAVPAPIVSAPTVHAAPQLVAETPVVNSYSIETGRTHVATQQHYGVAHVPGVVNVPFAKAVPVAAPVVHAAAPVVHAAPIAAPAYW